MKRLFPLFLSSCAGYASFSSHRSAALTPVGHDTVGGALGVAHYTLQDDPLEADAVALEGFYRRGVAPGVELGGKLSHLRWDGPFDGSNTLGYLEAAYELLPDTLAAVVPLGLGYGDDGGNGFHHLQVQPGVVYSATFSPTWSLDASFRLIATSSERLATFEVLSTAATVGLRYRSPLHRFELHPELGLMVDDLTGKFEVAGGGDAQHDLSVGDSLTVGLSLGVSWAH